MDLRLEAHGASFSLATSNVAKLKDSQLRIRINSRIEVESQLQ